MKKHIKTLSFILCLLLFAILFVGCSDVGAPEKSDVEPAYAVDRAALEIGRAHV